MKYHGIELKEITTSQIVDPPKEMLVWSDAMVKMNNKEPYKETVYAVVKLGIHYVAITSSYQWDYCDEIPEEAKPRLATNRELAEWCAKGKGQVWFGDKISTTYTYNMDLDDGVVPYFYKVRKWSDNDWHEPICDYLGIEE